MIIEDQARDANRGDNRKNQAATFYREQGDQDDLPRLEGGAEGDPHRDYGVHLYPGWMLERQSQYRAGFLPQKG